MLELTLDTYRERLTLPLETWLGDIAAPDLDLTSALTRAGAPDHGVRATPDAIRAALLADGKLADVQHVTMLDMVNQDTLLDWTGTLQVFDITYPLENEYAIPRDERIIILAGVDYFTLALKDADVWMLTTEERDAVYSFSSGHARCTLASCGYAPRVSDGGGYLEWEYGTAHPYRVEDLAATGTLTCPRCGSPMTAWLT